MSKSTKSPLTPTDVREILKVCGADGLLVGGQALAFWADFFAGALPPIFSSGVSSDADFIGDVALARKLARTLRWNEWLPSMDDATRHTAKVTKRSPGGGVKQVDFLSGVAGLDTQDLEQRAIDVDVPEIGRLRVIHPGRRARCTANGGRKSSSTSARDAASSRRPSRAARKESKRPARKYAEERRAYCADSGVTRCPSRSSA